MHRALWRRDIDKTFVGVLTNRVALRTCDKGAHVAIVLEWPDPRFNDIRSSICEDLTRPIFRSRNVRCDGMILRKPGQEADA